MSVHSKARAPQPPHRDPPTFTLNSQMPMSSSAELESSSTQIPAQNLAMGHEVAGLHVPSEIFAEIFLLCLPTSRFVVPSCTAAPLSVSGVCQRWREAALSSQKLWKSLCLHSKSVTPESGYVDFCHAWLSRAGSSPLSLSLEASASEDSINPILDLIRGLSPQWQDVELKLSKLQQTLSFPPRNYPYLERISIVPPKGGLLMSFLDAPKLVEVSLSRYTAHIHLPRRQLTAFRSWDIDVAPFFGILREATGLLGASFVIRRCDSSALPNTVLSLPQLQSLALGSTGNSFMNLSVAPMAILNCLKTRGLKSLSLSFPFRSVGFSSPSEISPFLSFVSRSSFQLHTLVLSYMPATAYALTQCLRATPSLMHLKLKPLGIDIGDLFAQLRGNPDVLPQLESFHLVLFSNISGVGYATASAVVQMLCWRWRALGIAQLQSFRLAHDTYNSRLVEAVTSHAEYRRLEEEGMTLYVGMAVTPLDTL